MTKLKLKSKSSRSHISYNGKHPMGLEHSVRVQKHQHGENLADGLTREGVRGLNKTIKDGDIAP